MAESSKWKPYLSLEWYTELPYKGTRRNSPVFRIRGIEHYFSFGTDDSYFDLSLKLTDHEASINDFSSFSATVYVHLDRGGNSYRVYGPQKVNCVLNYQCLNFGRSAITSYDKDLLHHNVVRFLVTFDSDDKPYIPGLNNERADKAIQTPTYLDTKFELENQSRDFAKLLEDESFSHPDLELVCGDSTFKAHSNLLSVRSDVFRKMLQTDMLEVKTGRVEIKDVEPDIFQVFLQYLYKGELPELTEDTAIQFYEVGDRYSVAGLKERCASFLMDNLTRSNACTFLCLADRHNDQEFRQGVMSYIVNEKIHLCHEYWSDFRRDNPHLALEVYEKLLSCNVSK